jgi:hypothetical protein
MKPLNRQKLDVVNKTRSNPFGWRGRFTPEFVGRRFTVTPQSSIIPS